MGIFDWIKKSNTVDGESPPEVKKTVLDPSCRSNEPVSHADSFVSTIQFPIFEVIGKFQLRVENELNWASLFVTGKVNDKLPGFDLRSRLKVELHYYNSDCFIIETNKNLYIVKTHNTKRIHLGEGLPEPMFVNVAKKNGAILYSGNLIGYLDFDTGLVTLLKFQWQPFRVAISKNFWLVGTRETYEGPGELYCFSTTGSYLWGLQFKEEFQTGFGLIKATPYHISISRDNENILVSTMDRLYRFYHDGTLVSRIVLSDLREEDFKEREYQHRANLPINSQTKEEITKVFSEIGEQIISGIEKALSLNEPLAGFAHDPQTGRIFILENKGRLTAWDPKGNLAWIKSFEEDGHYIIWIDDLVAVSLRSGNSFWMDSDGTIRLSVKLPKEAETILQTPGQDKYLIMCDDGRRYEIDKHTGEMIQGPEGNRNMRLFSFEGRIIFYDGYLWVAPPNHAWQTYQLKHEDHAIPITELSLDETAPQVKTDKPFKNNWKYKNPEDHPILHYAVDRKNKRFYIGRRKATLSQVEELQEQAAFGSHYPFSAWHEIGCYDFLLNQIWIVSFFSYLTSIGVSPDGDAIFVGLWGEGLAYDPGKLIILDAHGNEVATFRTTANPTSFHFKESDYGLFQVFEGPPYEVRRLNHSEWLVQQSFKSDAPEDIANFGSGLHQISVGSYKLNRTGKKSYQMSYQDITFDLKVSAAIYEAKVIPNSDNLLLRIGNKTLRVISPAIETLWEIKTKGNIASVVTGENGFLVLSKEEVLLISSEGKINWKIGCPPNSYRNNATWVRSYNAFLWEAGNRDYYQITMISPNGQIIKSQLFKDVNVDRSIDITEDESCFVLQIDHDLECYEID